MLAAPGTLTAPEERGEEKYSGMILKGRREEGSGCPE
jgi:hypothetical protein